MRLLKIRIIYFAILLLLVAGTQAQQTQIQYLSGTGSDNTVNWDFFCTDGMNANKWTTIAVPSCWELQGFGKYNYGFSKDSSRGKEKGLYKHSFSISPTWKNKKIQLVFEGVMTDAEVKINGRLAGEIHQGAYYVFKYDISKLIKFDASNLLEVTVAKHSANESVNDAERRGDFWLFGGIFRPVFLEALPLQHIERTTIDAKANGVFKANVYLPQNVTANKVSAQVYTLDGKKVGAAFTSVINKKNVATALQNTIVAPKLWSSESPNLYKVIFSLIDGTKTVHTVEQRFGFRTVEAKERDGIYVNGVKLKMKGVNRHSFWPTTGRTLNKTRSIEDVLLMKEMNMNAVRMSHYPPDGHFLDVCDSLGLFVMDELAGWHGTYNTTTGTKLVKEMLDHDVNHPSIIFWSNGNEGGHNLELDHLFPEQDPQQRPVVHPWQLFGGFETQHYREYNYGIGNYDNGHDIVMPTEFLHGMYDGGHGAGLEDYWEAMWKRPLSAGGFLWDFADQGVVRRDLNDSIDTDKNRGCDGIVGPYHQKEGSFFTIKEVWSPIFFMPKEITAAFDGKLDMENRFFYTNTNQCSFTYALKKLDNNKEVKGNIISPSIKPLEKGSLQIKLPTDWKNYDVLYVSAFGVDKREIFTWSFPITRPDKVATTLVDTVSQGKVQLQELDSLYHITVNSTEIFINRNNGHLQQVKNNSQNIPFNNGPVLQEGANNFKGFTHRFDGNNLVITSAFDRKESYNVLQWTIYPSGWVKMQVNYFPGDYFTSLVGVNFSFPEKEIKSVDYLGNGPYRVWKNRMKGNKFGIWHKDYNNTETGEYPFVYPEFKGYHSNLHWCKFNTTTQPFTVVTANQDVFLRLFTPAFKDDPWHNYQLTFPTGDISFMQGIPGIGTKTQKTENSGPMGMKNIFYDYEKDPSRAKILTLYFNFK